MFTLTAIGAIVAIILCEYQHLGLYLAKHIIEQLGGRITVESEVGAGTCFTVYLPAYVGGGKSEMAIEDDENVEAIANSGR